MFNTSWLTSAIGNLAFRKSYMTTVEASGRYVGGPETFGDFEARRFRYALYKALWENNAYDSATHSWANARNRGSGLYRHTRGTNTPAYRLAEVFATHVFNGQIDDEAGDGKAVPSAIPIRTKNDAIRRPIARFWRDTNMQVNKAILCRIGAVCGDTALYLHDNVRKRRIEGEVVDPSFLPYVGRDHQGNTTGYIRQEYRPNPRYNPARRDAAARSVDPGSSVDERAYVLYTEYCWREGDSVVFQTYRGDGARMEPFNWRGKDADGDELPWEWVVDYGFVPLVVLPHIRSWPGQEYGFGEYHALLTKTDEVNDLGSKLHDQIRKVVEGMWFFAGVRDPGEKLTVPRVAADAAGDSQPGRQEFATIYSPQVGATVTPMVIPLDIQFASLEILNQRDELEKDSPVLRFEHMRVSGDASAKALREARKPAEGVIQERRSGYDSMLVRAHMMAISMGSMRGYPEYEGFTPDSYEDGDLDHAIGHRSVYGVDPVDQAELDQIRAGAASTWKGAGVPVRLTLQMAGWTEDQLKEFDEAAAAEQQKALETQKAMIALNPPAPVAKKSPSTPTNGRPKPVPTSD